VVEAQQAELDLEDLSLMDLAEAFGQIAASVNFDTLGEHQVTDSDTPIELHAEDILDRLKREAATMPLAALFAGRSRQEMIGLFLATLELVRRRSVRVRQDQAGPIVVELREAEPEPPDVVVAHRDITPDVRSGSPPSAHEAGEDRMEGRPASST
jgi:chromatin segregation and condensation protein Rec8/ScpA/Scc1 (kleisin family)